MNKKLKRFLSEEVFETGEYTMEEVISNYFDLKKENLAINNTKNDENFDLMVAKKVVNDFIEIIDANESDYFNEEAVYYGVINFIKNVEQHNLIRDVFDSLKKNENADVNVNRIMSELILYSSEYAWDLYNITLDDLLFFDERNSLFKYDPELIDNLKTFNKINGLTRGDVVYKITKYVIKHQNYVTLNFLYEDYFDKNLKNMLVNHLEERFNEEKDEFALTKPELKVLHKYLKNNLNQFLNQIISNGLENDNVKKYYKNAIKSFNENNVENQIDVKVNSALQNKLKQVL